MIFVARSRNNFARHLANMKIPIEVRVSEADGKFQFADREPWVVTSSTLTGRCEGVRLDRCEPPWFFRTHNSSTSAKTTRKGGPFF